MHGQVLQMNVIVHIFKQIDFVPLFKWNLRMFTVKKIKPTLVVNLKVRDIEVNMNIWIHLLQHTFLLEQHLKRSGNNAPCLPGISSRHRVCLTRSSLTISKDCPIVSLNTALNHWPCYFIKHQLLSSIFIENSLELEIVIFFLVICYVSKVIILWYL